MESAKTVKRVLVLLLINTFIYVGTAVYAQQQESQSSMDSALVAADTSTDTQTAEADTPPKNAPVDAQAVKALQDEVAVLRDKVNVLEKTVADQAEVIAQSKELMEKIARVSELEKIVAGQGETISRQGQALDKITEVVPAVKIALAPPEAKTLVKAFVLDGVNLFQPKDFEPILKKYRNKELGMSDLKKVADEISAFYRKKGFVSSIAYLPTQEITDNTVEFKVVEGRVGDITIEQPKYSKASTIEKRFRVEKGQVLDSKKIEESLEQINSNRDRTMRAVLAPGKTPETSDILLKVEKERKPYHFYNELNNRGTRLTGKLRWGLGFTNTNLLGRDDALSLKVLASNRLSEVYSFSADYNMPVTPYNTRVGAYAAFAKADIGGQFAIINPEGRATIWGFYATHPLFKKEFVDEETSTSLKLAGNLTGGFDSLSVRNKILGAEVSHDEIRSVKGGINFDEKDSVGRAVVSAEVNAGIPNFLGSMKTHDVNASRIDAGGKFQKYNFYLNRLTSLPLNSVFLTTGRMQYTDNALVNPEQMVIGGADTVRGYPENEYLADYGWIFNMELRTPAFLIPAILRVPFDKKHARLIDAIQFVGFFDVGKGNLNKARVGEIPHKYLRGTGLGLRFDLYEHLRGRIDVGFPVGNSEPSDHSAHTVHFGLQYEW